MSANKEQFTEVIKQLIPISDLSPGAQNDVIEAALSQDSSSKLQAVDYYTAQSNLAITIAGEI